MSKDNPVNTFKVPKGSPFERIMEVASDLFFNQGYRATGINEVISKSGVAKATFYSNFKTKDELCKRYLQGLRENELNYVEECVCEAKGPLERFLAPLRSLGPWLLETEFRGCPFVNIASEVPDFDSPLRKEGVKAYDGVAARVQQLCEELLASDPKRYAGLDAKQLAREYMLIFAGAVALAEIYNSVTPVEQAEQILRAMIGNKSTN